MASDDMPLPSVSAKDWSPLLLNFIARCLVRDPAKRATAAQLASDPFLEDVVTQEELHSVIGALFMVQGLREAGFGL